MGNNHPARGLRATAAIAAAFTLTTLSIVRAQTFKSGIDMVPLTVTVTDPSGKYVRGLTGGSFAVFEDGVEQPVSFFASTDVPVDVALVVDTSGSMRGDLPLVQSAAIGLVRTLGAADRGAVVSVNEHAGVPQGFTSEKDKLEAAVRGLAAAGSTALYDGLYVMLREFQRERRNAPQIRRQVLVLLSDGLDNRSRLSFEDVLDLARRADVNIYVIALRGEAPVAPRSQLPGQMLQAEYAMNAVARDSGGRCFFPRSARELPAIYGAIAQELGSQYALGYLPARPGGDGGFRRVSVRLAPELNASARTRSGYYAARSTSSVYDGR